MAEVFFNRFSYQTKKEKTLINSFKRKSEEVIVDNENSSIVCGIRLEECGKYITPKSVQALMVLHEENKLALYNANHNIK